MIVRCFRCNREPAVALFDYGKEVFTINRHCQYCGGLMRVQGNPPTKEKTNDNNPT